MTYGIRAVPLRASKDDHRDLVSDRSTPEQRAAAMTEEPRLLAHGVSGERVDVGKADGAQPGGAIAGEVELPSLRARAVGKEPRIVRVAGEHRVAQVGGDFV